MDMDMMFLRKVAMQKICGINDDDSEEDDDEDVCLEVSEGSQVLYVLFARENIDHQSNVLVA